MKFSDSLIINGNIKSPIGEAYKSIRTNIQYSMPGGQLRTLLVTSTSPEEGKSTTVSNLAITMAESGKRVLLIDADLRKSVIYKLFAVSNHKGLTNVLVENLNYKEAVKASGVPLLDILPGGPRPPNPSEILGSRRMQNLLEIVKEDYNLILIDTPPVLPVTDASVLASFVDGVVLVTTYGVTTFDGATRAKAQLQNVGAKILGVIHNRIPANKHGGHYHYYDYYD
ncbi:MAG: CpsD/CapB family tyrosine-protein kinase [Clostridiales bacterium]|nr:CpsD/CapB family tyrosine-protein kinase [Clostridiales bacterium]